MPFAKNIGIWYTKKIVLTGFKLYQLKGVFYEKKTYWLAGIARSIRAHILGNHLRHE
jgi:hypothetical protein